MAYNRAILEKKEENWLIYNNTKLWYIGDNFVKYS
jgi:hypothetical protein